MTDVGVSTHTAGAWRIRRARPGGLGYLFADTRRLLGAVLAQHLFALAGARISSRVTGSMSLGRVRVPRRAERRPLALVSSPHSRQRRPSWRWAGVASRASKRARLPHTTVAVQD